MEWGTVSRPKGSEKCYECSAVKLIRDTTGGEAENTVPEEATEEPQELEGEGPAMEEEPFSENNPEDVEEGAMLK